MRHKSHRVRGCRNLLDRYIQWYELNAYMGISLCRSSAFLLFRLLRSLAVRHGCGSSDSSCWGSIPRSRIQSIIDADTEVGAAFAPVAVVQTATAYQPVYLSGATKTVLIGPPPGKTAMQLSVHQTSLLNALQAWTDATLDDPGLIDRVEAILRGRISAST